MNLDLYRYRPGLTLAFPRTRPARGARPGWVEVTSLGDWYSVYVKARVPAKRNVHRFGR
jgi:hypothetical protein